MLALEKISALLSQTSLCSATRLAGPAMPGFAASRGRVDRRRPWHTILGWASRGSSLEPQDARLMRRTGLALQPDRRRRGAIRLVAEALPPRHRHPRAASVGVLASSRRVAVYLSAEQSAGPIGARQRLPSGTFRPDNFNRGSLQLGVRHDVAGTPESACFETIPNRNDSIAEVDHSLACG